ncbi:MAG: hypothetical protein OET90_00315, partial [Desulfuromonadales bacterium]|nr:hypothetical protein [Desulfuromonadales bacterium]
VFAAMKAVRGILKKFDQKQFAKIIDNSYLRRAAQALTDFLTAVRGFDVAPDAEELDLNALLEAFVGDMSANVHADRSIYETLHDNQQYLDALAARVAHVPIFSDLEIEHIAESRLNPVWLDRQRFNDALQGLLEQLTVAGAGKIVLTTRRKEDQNYLEVVAEQTSQNPDASLRLASHSRRFAACGVVMAPLELASGCGVALRLP